VNRFLAYLQCVCVLCEYACEISVVWFYSGHWQFSSLCFTHTHSIYSLCHPACVCVRRFKHLCVCTLRLSILIHCSCVCVCVYQWIVFYARNDRLSCVYVHAWGYTNFKKRFVLIYLCCILQRKTAINNCTFVYFKSWINIIIWIFQCQRERHHQRDQHLERNLVIKFLFIYFRILFLQTIIWQFYSRWFPAHIIATRQ
jgi:hypothetical protein